MDGQLGGVDPDTVRSDPDAGVTLIELLVVVAILSVLAVGVSITALRPEASQAVADQQWFMRSYDHNRSLAIHAKGSRGLNVRPQGLVPVHRQQDIWQDQSSAHRWRARVSLRAERPVDAAATQPDIVFLPTGQTTPFEISFSGQGSSTIRCRSDGWTGLTCADG